MITFKEAIPLLIRTTDFSNPKVPVMRAFTVKIRTYISIVHGSCDEQELQCAGVRLCLSYDVLELQFTYVAVCGGHNEGNHNIRIFENLPVEKSVFFP